MNEPAAIISAGHVAQVEDTGEPAGILEKLTAGKIAKAAKEIWFTGQAYVLDTTMTLEAALKAVAATGKAADIRGFFCCFNWRRPPTPALGIPFLGNARRPDRCGRLHADTSSENSIPLH